MTKKYNYTKKTGRPKLYTETEAMQAIIDKYFSDCDEQKEPYTMSGLAYALGMDRRTLLDYGKTEKFYPTIKVARNKVEMSVEKLMLKSNGVVAGVIFNAKNNFGWRDKTEVESSGEIVHKYEDMTDEQLEAALKARQDRTT